MEGMVGCILHTWVLLMIDSASVLVFRFGYGTGVWCFLKDQDSSVSIA
jgi:hypothetical protein